MQVFIVIALFECIDYHGIMLRLKEVRGGAVIPSRGSPGSAGYDLSSAVVKVIQPWARAVVPTGWAMTVPPCTYGRIAPRSGLAVKKCIDVAAGVVDADYTGEVGVVLVNNSNVEYKVNIGDRIAQLVLEMIVTPEIEIVDDLADTTRGAGGFGSTGITLKTNTAEYDSRFDIYRT